MRRGDRLLAAASGLPAVAVTGWLLVTFPLLLGGVFQPVPALLLGVPVAVAVAVAVGRRIPAVPAPGWAVWGSVAVAVGFAVLTAATHSEHLVLRRDPGTYALFGQWLADHGSLPVPGQVADVGGPDPALSLDSPGFFGRDGSVVPQFMAGLPMLLAAGHWVGGWTGLFVVPAVLGGLAVLAMAGLAARLVGGAWAPLGALGLAVLQPMLHAARSPYSEPLAQLLLLGGLSLLVDAMRRSDRRLAAAAGLLLGTTTLVRIDSLREVVLLVPVVGILAARRSPLVAPVTAGLAAGVAAGLVDGLVLSRPYLEENASSLVPLAGLGAVAVAGTAWVVAWTRRRRPAVRPGRRLASAAAVVVVAGGLLLAARPWFLTVRQDPDHPTSRTVAGIQAATGLPVDPGRTYAEHSVEWLAWYTGWPLLAAALAAAAVLVHRALAGRDAVWAPVLLVVLGSSAAVLWRPGITPDHPWADRRLVPVVLPGVVLLATWALAHVTRRVRRRAGLPRAGAVVAAGAALLVGPAAVATAPVATTSTEQGQDDAVRAACDALGPEDSVLLVDGRARREWAQVLRGVCGVPVAAMPDPTAEALDRVAGRIRERGRRPVLAAAESPGALAALGAGGIRHPVGLDTREDDRLLTRRPDGTTPLRVDLWLGEAPVGRP